MPPTHSQVLVWPPPVLQMPLSSPILQSGYLQVLVDGSQYWVPRQVHQPAPWPHAPLSAHWVGVFCSTIAAGGSQQAAQASATPGAGSRSRQCASLVVYSGRQRAGRPAPHRLAKVLCVVGLVANARRPVAGLICMGSKKSHQNNHMLGPAPRSSRPSNIKMLTLRCWQ